MGATAVLVGGTLLGLGASYAMNRKAERQSADIRSAMMTGNSVVSVPPAPRAPSIVKTDDGRISSAEAEEARKRELQLAAVRRRENSLNVTGGLGVTGKANLVRKTLLGE